EVKLEDLEFTTSETLEVKKRELKTLLTRRNNSDNNTYEKRLLILAVSFYFWGIIIDVERDSSF
ncbi:MAG: hypothetical protein K0R36_3933, partial [Chryseobacterium sp.]|nr:hypothetical protein [Chryseobacterium sp.]